MRLYDYDKNYKLKTKNNKKYIFVVGGVLSSLGKGIVSSGIGALLETMGYKISMQKIDPYYNSDAGLLSPIEHGEVFVCKDGLEGDLDLGYYYRFTNAKISSDSSVTTGSIYKQIAKNEVQGAFLGKTIQIIPHVTDIIQNKIIQGTEQEHGVDVSVVEIGGTVGDIESLPFLEALRQFKTKNKSIIVLLTYVPTLDWSNEQKTKPTQHAMQTIRSYGLAPDLVLCRSAKRINEESLLKVVLHSGLDKQCVMGIKTVDSIYTIPYEFNNMGLDNVLCKLLDLNQTNQDMSFWNKIAHITQTIHSRNNVNKFVHICFVGKYMYTTDCYRSLYEAFEHISIELHIKIKISTLEADEITQTTDLSLYDGIVIPGGFGARGWEGLILTSKLCRQHNIPCFGICFGYQAMIIDIMRHECGIEHADSMEMNTNNNKKDHIPVYGIVPWKEKILFNNTYQMRLGAYNVSLLCSRNTCLYMSSSNAFYFCDL